MTAFYGREDGSKIKRSTMTGKAEKAVELAITLAQQIKKEVDG